MIKLKEFYQYKRNLLRNKKIFQKRLLKKVKQSSSPLFFNKTKKVLSSSAQGVFYLKTSMTNTIVALTNLKAKVICVKSCGALGYKGKKKRSTKLAVESVINAVIEKAKDLGWKKLFLFLNGFGKGRFYIINCLRNANIAVLCLRDVTSIPHNGCRPRKLRRG
jgi:small subunit ribosomal protein S11